MSIAGSIFLGMMLMYSAGQGAAQPSGGQSVTKPSASEGAKPTTQGVDADYKIGPQDVLRIDVWKEPEITRTSPVRPDGKISLPLLNDVQAAGLTPAQLTEVITNGLKKFINNPQVNVSVSEINSDNIFKPFDVAGHEWRTLWTTCE